MSVIFEILHSVFSRIWICKKFILVKDDVAQMPLFEAQLEKHVLPNDEVVILNAFPMILYEYFPKDKFDEAEKLEVEKDSVPSSKHAIHYQTMYRTIKMKVIKIYTLTIIL